jgi:hypothetical protein
MAQEKVGGNILSFIKAKFNIALKTESYNNLLDSLKMFKFTVKDFDSPNNRNLKLMIIVNFYVAHDLYETDNFKDAEKIYLEIFDFFKELKNENDGFPIQLIALSYYYLGKIEEIYKKNEIQAKKYYQSGSERDCSFSNLRLARFYIKDAQRHSELQGKHSRYQKAMEYLNKINENDLSQEKDKIEYFKFWKRFIKNYLFDNKEEQEIIKDIEDYIKDVKINREKYIINDVRDETKSIYHEDNLEKTSISALILRMESYRDAAHLIIQYHPDIKEDIDREFCKGCVNSYYQSYRDHLKKINISDYKTYFGNYFTKIALFLKEKIKFEHNELNQSESLVNWQKPIKPIVTISEMKDYKIVQFDASIVNLTNQQKEEFKCILNDSPPAWFSSLLDWEKNFWKNQLLKKKEKEEKNETCHMFYETNTQPSTIRKYPGLPFFMRHGLLIYDKNGKEVFRSVRKRSSIISPSSIDLSKNKKKNEIQRLSLQNINQFIQSESAHTENASSRNLSKPIPVLYQTLLSPPNPLSGAILKLIGIPPEGEMEKIKHFLSKNYGDFFNAIYDREKFEFISTNYAVNFAEESRFSGKLSGKSKDNTEEVNKILILVSQYLDNIQSSTEEKRKKTEKLVVYLKEGIPKSVDEKIFSEAIQSVDIKERFLVRTLREYLRLLLQENKKPESSIEIAFLEKILVKTIGGFVLSSCRSGKDRNGMLILMEDVEYCAYFCKKEGKNELEWNQIFLKLFKSGHQQLAASTNALGCIGIKSIDGEKKLLYLDAILPQLSKEIPEKILKVNNLFANLNRVKDVKDVPISYEDKNMLDLIIDIDSSIHKMIEIRMKNKTNFVPTLSSQAKNNDFEWEFHKVTIGLPQIKNLQKFLDEHSTIHTLKFNEIAFLDSAFSGFLDLLYNKKSKLKKINLINCSLGDKEAKAIAEKLSEYTSLMSLNLSDNRISNSGFEAILKKGLPQSLQKLSFCNNLIDYTDSQNTYDKFGEMSLGLANGIEINLSGNLIKSLKKHNKGIKNILDLILMRANVPIEELIDCKFNELTKKNDNEYYLSLQCSSSEKIIIKLSYGEVEMISDEKMHLKAHADDEFFNYIFKMNEKKLLIKDTTLKQKVFQKDKKEVKLIRKELLDYHPDAPLKSYLRTHSLFKSSVISIAKGLLIPRLEITLDKWIVYLIAKKQRSGDILGQHAWLAYEGLTKHGQRFFKVANLTTPQSGYWKQFKNLTVGGGTDPRISFFIWGNSMLETIKYLTENCIMASFYTNRSNVKALHSQILEDEKALHQTYKTTIFSYPNVTDVEEKEEIVNCIKWAINRIEESLEIKIPSSYKGNYVPYNVVNSLRKLGEPVDILNLSDSKSPIAIKK